MDTEAAFNIVAQACARMQGTLEEHQTVQRALQVLHDVLPLQEQRDNGKKEEAMRP